MKLFPQAAETVATEPELDLPEGNSGNGTFFGFQVQARYNYHEPKDFRGLLLDKRWRPVPFLLAPGGVPIGNEWESPVFKQTHCYGYEAAQALRWWFLADVNANSVAGSLCVETRIVRMRLEYSYKATASDVVDLVQTARPPRLPEGKPGE